MDHSKLKVQLLSGKTPLLLFFRRHSLPPQFSFNAFRHHIIPAVREIETRLSAVKHLLARQTFVLSTWLQVQSRRHNWILFCEVIGISCSQLKACQPIARSWASASLWVVAPFCEVLFLSFGLLNESMWSSYSAMRSKGWRFQHFNRLISSVVWHSVLWCSSTLTNEFSRLSKQPCHSYAWWST
jgi:hypothetical protein